MEEKLPNTSDGSLVFGGIALLGIALWVQLLGPALLGEFQSELSSFFHVIAYSAPIVVVLAGVMLRSQIVLLMVFLSSFIPGVVLLPDTFDLVEGSGSVRIGLSCLVYILAVSYSFAMQYAPRKAADSSRLELQHEEDVLEGSKEVLGSPTKDDFKETSERLQTRIGIRLLYVLLILVTLQYAVHGDPLVGRTIAQSYENPSIAMIVISVSMFFIWCICVYMYFIVPALNFEHDYTKWKVFKQQGSDMEFSSRKIIERNAFPFLFLLLMLSLIAIFI